MKIGSRGRNSYFGKVGRAGPGEHLGRMKGLQCDVFCSPLETFILPSITHQKRFISVYSNKVELDIFYLWRHEGRGSLSWFRFSETEGVPKLHVPILKRAESHEDCPGVFSKVAAMRTRGCSSQLHPSNVRSLQSRIPLSLSLELRLWSGLLGHTGTSAFSQRRVSFSQFYFFLLSSPG